MQLLCLLINTLVFYVSQQQKTDDVHNIPQTELRGFANPQKKKKKFDT